MSILDGRSSVGGAIGVVLNGIQRHRNAVFDTADVTADVALWFRTYRDGLPCAGITISAASLRQPREAAAVQRAGHCVDVRSGEELTRAVAAGIAPARIVMHDDGVTAGPLRRAVMVGAGRFVVGRAEQVSVLASSTTRTQRVLVDVTAGDPRTIAKVMDSPRLQLIGLHAQLPSSTSTVQHYAAAISGLIAQMAHLRGEHGVLLTRISVAGGSALSPRPLTKRSLSALNLAIEDAIDDGCARYRFPRPVLMLSPEH